MLTASLKAPGSSRGTSDVPARPREATERGRGPHSASAGVRYSIENVLEPNKAENAQVNDVRVSAAWFRKPVTGSCAA